MFHGSIVAIVTPMISDESIDYRAFARLVEWHIAEGTDAIVVLGTTGESPTVTAEERVKLIQLTMKTVNGRVPVIVGSGTYSTAGTIKLTKEAMSLGADGVLIVTPYFNRPTQEGLFQHFRAVAKAVPIPQIVYNVPARTGCDLKPETMIRLADMPNIVGIKEASGDISRVKTLLTSCGDRLDLLSGDDKTCFDFMVAGGKGVISVTANIVPAKMHELCVSILNNNLSLAKKLNQELDELHARLGIEANPIPVKWALMEMGKISSGIRLPLTMLSPQYQPALRQTLQRLHLLRS